MRKASLAPAPVRRSVGWSVRNTFRFPLWRCIRHRVSVDWTTGRDIFSKSCDCKAEAERVSETEYYNDQQLSDFDIPKVYFSQSVFPEVYFRKCTQLPHLLSFACLFLVAMMIITLSCYLLLRPDSEVVFTQIIRSLHGEYTAQFGDANTIHWHPTKRNNQIEKQEEITQSVASSPGSVTYPQRSNCVKCEYNFICTAMMGSTKSCFVRENIPSVHLKMPPSYIFIYIQVAFARQKKQHTHKCKNWKHKEILGFNESPFIPLPTCPWQIIFS